MAGQQPVEGLVLLNFNAPGYVHSKFMPEIVK